MLLSHPPQPQHLPRLRGLGAMRQVLLPSIIEAGRKAGLAAGSGKRVRWHRGVSHSGGGSIVFKARRRAGRRVRHATAEYGLTLDRLVVAMASKAPPARSKAGKKRGKRACACRKERGRSRK
jgi:hypothetical protein